MNWDEGYGIIREAKTGQDQYFTIFPVLTEKLKPLQTEGYVWDLTYDRLGRLINKARIKAGIKQKGTVKIL